MSRRDRGGLRIQRTILLPPRLPIALLFGIAILLAASWAAVSAQESKEANPPETVDPTVLQLDAGQHLVGWLGDTRSVQRIERQHPAIESIQAWDALRQELHEPEQLVAGEAYVVTVREGEQVTWQRPMTPVKSRIQLRRGRNLVTWLGPDNWPLDRVAMGIGRALIQAEWHGGTYTPSDSESETPLPKLKRGTALWVEVSRTVNWLQPAGVMPKIVFAGEASSELQTVVHRDSVDVMNHFANEFGVQPDGSILTVYVAADPDSLLDALERDGRESSGVYGLWYGSGGWANPQGWIVLKLEQWKPDFWSNEQEIYGEYTYGRGVLAHEYYHAIQQQTSSTDAASWLVEGGADWAEAGLRRRDAESTFDEELASNRESAATDRAPPLDHAERDVETWHYTLGALASHRLALRSGPNSLIEFWRALLPSPLGPLGRWQSKPPWQSVFQDVFGFPVGEFYADFAVWRSGLAPVAVRGRVVGPDGEGLPYVKVTAHTEELMDGYTSYTYIGDAYTDASGQVELTVTEGGVVKVGVDLGGCSVYYTSNGMVPELRQAENVSASVGSRQNILVQLSEENCVWRISGRLVTASDQAVEDVSVYVDGENTSASVRTDRSSGAFSITLKKDGTYRLRVSRDGCSMYYQTNGAVGSWNDAEMITIERADVDDLRFVLPDGWCELSISGTLIDSDGVGVAEADVLAQTDEGSSWWARTDADGKFTITVPETALYRLQARMSGCPVWYRNGIAVTDYDRASAIKVEEGGKTGIRLRLPKGVCKYRILGRILDWDGIGIAEAEVSVQSDEGSSWARADSEGAFGITVPQSGTYRVSARIDGCQIYYKRNAATGQWSQATQVRVSNSDVTDIVIQPSVGMCELRISGKLLNSDGSPRSGQWVSAGGNTGNSGAHTGTDGSFSFAVPSRGSYRLSVWIDGCSIVHGSRGPVKNWNSARQITITNTDITDIEFQLPDNPASFCD